jgi:RND family efflux transporter MFP subunit
MPTRLILLLSAVALAGCNKAPTTSTAPAKTVEVIVDHPTIKTIVDKEEFPGRLEPVNSVVVRSRVTGYLEKVHFMDGADVKIGDLLFEIDPLPYAAEAERAKAAVTQAVAKRDRLKKDYDRMNSASVGAVSKEELDRVTGDLAEAEAAVQVATANQKLADTNLAYTKVLAKTAGRIGRRMVDPGNLVKADDTILTTIVSQDSVYASFDIDERTLLRLNDEIAQGKISSLRKNPEDPSKAIQVEIIAQANEEEFRSTGDIDFTDNQVNPRTGTFRIRAVLENPAGRFSPGLYVRIRFPVGRRHDAVLVPEEAIGSDQGQKYVFLVNDKDEVIYRKVTLGPSEGKLRVIKKDKDKKEEGVSPTDRVVVSGMQRIKAGSKVTVKQTDHPATVDPSTTPSTTVTSVGGR